MSNKVVTAESVCEGHPDKLCDLIADGILDACLMVDPYARVGCEVLATKGEIIVAGEITCAKKVDYKCVVKKVLENVGYNSKDYKITIKVHKQSEEINSSVTQENGVIGAGDQGVVYGYACNDTKELLPLPVVLANKITRSIDLARHWHIIDGLKPDGKCLVSVEYENNKPKCIKSIVISVQHEEYLTKAEIMDFIVSYVFAEALSDFPISSDTEVLLNPSGKFIIGGPSADTGLTGRKLMCDTYGGIAHHGGGAFSGKDATKVDRSGAYMARFIAKNIVAAHLAEKCEVCISYAIGKPDPIDFSVNCFGTSIFSNEYIENIVTQVFDLTPNGIINTLKLREPNFSLTTCYSHFLNQDLTWEKTVKTSELLQQAMNKNKYPYWR